ncbi:MAG: DUF6502 family protein [Pseudomonadota bacterium]
MAELTTSVSIFLRRLLRPIVGITLRCGIPFRRVADVLKLAYVEVALNEYGEGGKPATISRVAMLTGLTRRDAANQKELLDNAVQVPGGDRVHSAARVLAGWHTDPDFSTADGQAKALPADGEGSFAALYLRYSVSDVPLSTMLSEMLKVGAVTQDADGAYVAKTRYFQPEPLDPQAIERAGHVLSDLGQTVQHNMYRASGEESRFEGRAWSALVTKAQNAAFRDFLETCAQDFLEKVDAWLIEHEDPGADANNYVRFGAGVYEIRTPAADVPKDHDAPAE